jgi:hypothetical protein
VCTKQLDLTDRRHGAKIIEWVHLLKILGAHKIHIQIRNFHPNLIKILNHLQSKELIEWNRYKDPNTFTGSRLYDDQHRLLQMNVINDCFYKVRNLYDYIAILDFDEVIMPVKEQDRTWQDILSHLDRTFLHYDSISSANVYYPHHEVEIFKDIPNHHYMLLHVQRSIASTLEIDSIKSFIRPDFVLVVHNHYAVKCLSQDNLSLTWCSKDVLPKNISQLNHYRSDVADQFKATVLDTKIWKYKDELIKAVSETIEEIN